MTRAAANSSASGRSSRRRQIPWTASSASKSGLSARALARKKPTASSRLEGRHGVFLLAPDVERFPARDEDGQPRTGGEQTGDVGGRFDHLLEVVEEEEQPPGGDVVRQAVLGAERLGGSLEHDRWVAQRRQRDPPDPVGEGVGRETGSLQGEPGLARPAGPGHCQQAAVRTAQQCADLGELGRSAEERRGRHRQVRPVERRERRELAVAKLVDPLGCREVLEPVLAEVVQPGTAEEGGRGGRHEDLPAVACRGDPRALVHVVSDIALRAEQRGAGVDADPHPDRT